ncbi:MAG: metalloregulator ArsR/SmtB family transcription factor [Bacilli bacterium]|nr:metalloregulator ArsR/SmtB family transcription factor [Bacilli bacterium]
MQILNYQKVDRLANTLAILGDPVRLSIVVYLIEHTANVTEITEYLKMSQPAISHHLRLLKTSGILKSEKKGKLVYYSLVDERVKNIIESGLVHMSNGE